MNQVWIKTVGSQQSVVGRLSNVQGRRHTLPLTFTFIFTLKTASIPMNRVWIKHVGATKKQPKLKNNIKHNGKFLRILFLTRIFYANIIL